LDIRLTEDGDIDFVNGDTVVTTSYAESVQQRIIVRLRTFLGEWFLDLNYGVPYFQTILSKGTSKQTIDMILQQTILETEGVLNITTFSSEINPNTRDYKMTFVAKLDNGETIQVIL